MEDCAGESLAIFGPSLRSTGRSCTRAVLCSIIQPTDGRWNSKCRCPTTCNSFSMRSFPKTMSEALPELKHSDVIYKGRVFNITVDQVAYRDGRMVKMECVRHRGSVVLLPMTAPDRILLVRQYRHVVGRWLWELPAGTLEPDESLQAAALRECHEKVGKVAGHAKKLMNLFPSPGFC